MLGVPLCGVSSGGGHRGDLYTSAREHLADHLEFLTVVTNEGAEEPLPVVELRLGEIGARLA